MYECKEKLYFKFRLISIVKVYEESEFLPTAFALVTIFYLLHMMKHGNHLALHRLWADLQYNLIRRRNISSCGRADNQQQETQTCGTDDN